MRIVVAAATAADAPAIADLRNAAADDLVARHGPGHWSGQCSERGVQFHLRHDQVYVARRASRVIGTFTFTKKKPWAIDRTYFTPVPRPLYLIAMAVAPELQRHGVGRRCLEEARRIAARFPAQSICLDAYDAAAGAGEFYRRCGFQERGRAAYKGVPLIYFELLV